MWTQVNWFTVKFTNYRSLVVISLAGKVTVGLAESNDSLLLGLWLSYLPADCQENEIGSVPNDRDQVRDFFQ